MREETEENPSLRQRFGEKVAARIRAQSRQEKQAEQFKAALKAAFPRGKGRKSDAGKIVLVAASKTRTAKPGDRVKPTHKGKVFAVYVSKTGKLTPYRERVREAGKRAKPKTKVPVPYSPRTIDPKEFPTKGARKLAMGMFFAKGDRLVEPLVVRARTRNVGWHEDVVPRLSASMAKLARKATGGKGVGDLPMVVEARITLELPGGGTKTVVVEDKFGQRKEQGRKGPTFYQPYLSRQFYSFIGEALQGLGVVSQGSASRVSRSPENKGKPVSRWRWRGGPWHKRDLYKTGKVARVSRVEVQPYLVTVGRREA